VRDGLETEFSARELSGRVIRCHKHRVKKIVTEESPDLFLSLSEDGTVRQHDLRVKHRCTEGECPSPLVEMRDSDGDFVELSNMSLSRMTPYQFVVVGESPCVSGGSLFLTSPYYLSDWHSGSVRRVLERERG
jgi:WD repeat-containing protein 42A